MACAHNAHLNGCVEPGCKNNRLNASTGRRAAELLEKAARTMLDRDAAYKGSDAMYAATMAQLFPNGVQLLTDRDQHRYHLLMLLVVKLTRYASNWEGGHDDSLTDLANYAAMLQAVDRA